MYPKSSAINICYGLVLSLGGLVRWPCVVRWSCEMVLCLDGLVRWSCLESLWSCEMVLCDGLVRWSCETVVCDGLVRWSCVMVLCLDGLLR